MASNYEVKRFRRTGKCRPLGNLRCRSREAAAYLVERQETVLASPCARRRVHPKKPAGGSGNVRAVPLERARHRKHHRRGLVGYVPPVEPLKYNKVSGKRV